MESKIRYCWLSPDLKFSDSWSEEEHEECLDEKAIGYGLDNGWRLIRYEIVGNDFEFQDSMILTHKPTK